MNLVYTAYNLIGSVLFFALLPSFWLCRRTGGRFRKSLYQRLGQYGPETVRGISGSPRIWIHAVSVGEIQAAGPIIDALCARAPDSAIILSTTTEQGQRLARKKFGTLATCIYAPFDFILSVREALTTLRPDALVMLETEIWPNWLMEARRLGIRTALVNGRISPRSFRRYLRIRSLMKSTLDNFLVFSMITEADAGRIRRMGADPDRIRINGNAKYDHLSVSASANVRESMRRTYGVRKEDPVFVCGSIRGEETRVVLDAYRAIRRELPETVLIIAPRHLEKVPRMERELEDMGLGYQLRTDLDGREDRRSAPVVIVNTIGELPATYSLASVVFCGGSLVPLGGQNVMEPAAWGKPVLYGPSMDDFLDARLMLEAAGGGIGVRNGRELSETALGLLRDLAGARAVGLQAREAVLQNERAGEKHADAIFRMLQSG